MESGQQTRHYGQLKMTRNAPSHPEDAALGAELMATLTRIVLRWGRGYHHPVWLLHSNGDPYDLEAVRRVEGAKGRGEGVRRERGGERSVPTALFFEREALYLRHSPRQSPNYYYFSFFFT